jgi:hypothetical protein
MSNEETTLSCVECTAIYPNSCGKILGCPTQERGAKNALDKGELISPHDRRNHPAPVETTPEVFDIHATGAKADNGKLRAGLVVDAFAPALSALAEVGTFGARKYTDNGWLEVEDGVNRYNDAQMRHRLLRLQGEELDPESGLPHEYHEVWNALAGLTLKLRGKKA